ncbi:MAG: translation elongation factor Ts [Patescibacteria group bacterium]|nr:translation elongation factor Ts [Patescibacteria group bacterium]
MITASQVNELRQRTGAGMMDCKKALEETNGDIEKGIDWLRQKGIAKAAKKAHRETKSGLLFVAGDQKKITIVKFFCETDFVASNDEFRQVGQELAKAALKDGSIDNAQDKITAIIAKIGENMSAESAIVEAGANELLAYYLHSTGRLAVVIGLSGSDDQNLARDIAMQAAAMNPAVISPEQVDSALIEREKGIWKTELSGKPENIQEQIMAGKEKKFRAENSLLGQSFIKDSSKTMVEVIGKAKVERMVRVEI